MRYSAPSFADIKSIHPSKRSRKQCKEPKIDEKIKSESQSICRSISVNDIYIPPNYKITHKRKYSITNVSSKIAVDLNMSTRKVAKVCNLISKKGYDIPTPSQTGIWRGLIKKAKEVETKIKSIIQHQIFCLYLLAKLNTSNKISSCKI